MILKGDLRIGRVKGAANDEETEDTLHHNSIILFVLISYTLINVIVIKT